MAAGFCLAACEVCCLSASKQPIELTTFGLVMNLNLPWAAWVSTEAAARATRVATECYVILSYFGIRSSYLRAKYNKVVCFVEYATL